MQRIRTIVVDDEKPARTRLLQLLEKEPEIEIVGSGRDGVEAVKLIRSCEPDLLFLDIRMPNMDGFDVIRKVAPEKMPVTVFVTAYDQYAIQAFEAHALDYLLKPFSDERFKTTVHGACNQVRTRNLGDLGMRFVNLLQDPSGFGGVTGYAQRIVVKEGGHVMFLDTNEIDWIEAAGVYVYLHVGSKSHLYRATIGQIEQRLDPKKFVRIHRSTIINTICIRELRVRSHGDYTVVLKHGVELTLSRNYRPQLEEWLHQPL